MFLRLLLASFCAVLAVGCGGRRASETVAEAPTTMEEDAAPAAPAEEEVVAEAAPPLQPEDLVAAALAGDHVLEELTIMVVPGLGYEVGGHMLDLQEIERLLQPMHAANPWRPVRIRVSATGTVTVIQPILDVCQRTGMRNITLWDGHVDEEPTSN